MKLKALAALLTVASMVAIGGQPGLWSLPHWVEFASLVVFTLGFGYFVVWQSCQDLKSSKSVGANKTCPTSGQKRVVPITSDEEDTDGLQSPIGLV